MDKILITGASGFIGSFLVEEALHQGFEVYAGIRSTSTLEYLKDERIKFIELDISSQIVLEEKFSTLLEEFGGFDYVIHNAGITQASKIDDFAKVNYVYTRILINALQSSRMPLKKFILISSLAALGPGNIKTFEPIKISDAPNPVSEYGKSKLMAEQHIRSQSSFPYLILNPTAVYGPRDKDFLGLVKMINSRFEFYIGKERQVISLIYVKDLAKAVLLAMKSEKVNHSYLISDGEDYDKEYLGTLIGKILKRKTFKCKLPVTPLRLTITLMEKIYSLFGKRPFLNIEKLNEISGANWKCQSDELWSDIDSLPAFTLEQGLEETISWYKENGCMK